MTDLIQVRRGTSAEWAAANPVLAVAEPGLDTTTGTFKLGDGVAAWLTLPATGGQTVFDSRYAPVSLGKVAYAEITSNSAAITVVTDVGGLTVTWGAVATRRYRTSVYANWFGSVAGDLLFADITDGAGVGKQEQRRSISAGGYGAISMSLVETGLSGSVTRKVQHSRNAGTGSSQIVATALLPAYILVEDIGT